MPYLCHPGQTCYSDAIYESVQRTTEWVLNEATGLYIEHEVNKPITQDSTPVVTPEKAEIIAKATETFIKKIDRKGSKEIKAAFADWFKTL